MRASAQRSPARKAIARTTLEATRLIRRVTDSRPGSHIAERRVSRPGASSQRPETVPETAGAAGHPAAPGHRATAPRPGTGVEWPSSHGPALALPHQRGTAACPPAAVGGAEGLRVGELTSFLTCYSGAIKFGIAPHRWWA